MNHTRVASPIPSSSTPAHYHLPASQASKSQIHTSSVQRSPDFLHLGIRVQLTFWYTAIFGLLLLLAGRPDLC